MKNLLLPATARLLQKHGFPQPSDMEGLWYYNDRDEATLVLYEEDGDLGIVDTFLWKQTSVCKSETDGWVLAPSTEMILQQLYCGVPPKPQYSISFFARTFTCTKRLFSEQNGLSYADDWWSHANAAEASALAWLDRQKRISPTTPHNIPPI